MENTGNNDENEQPIDPGEDTVGFPAIIEELVEAVVNPNPEDTKLDRFKRVGGAVVAAIKVAFTHDH